jgi:hypothetical protein
MTTYRLYCLDGWGHIGLADWLEVPSDQDAIEEAHRLKPTAAKCEIWQGDRLIAALNPDDFVAL